MLSNDCQKALLHPLAHRVSRPPLLRGKKFLEIVKIDRFEFGHRGSA